VTQRVALVTGAARGQGWAITQRLRADGFFVAACDINAGELRAAVDGLDDHAVIGIPLDVTLEWEWQQAVAKTLERFGRRGRTRLGGYSSQRSVSRTDRDADARCGDSGAAGGHLGVRPNRAAV
jgi:NAD(P)-dependent dehydrogenase (short-subunit alcohol dehydrogenase family)